MITLGNCPSSWVYFQTEPLSTIAEGSLEESRYYLILAQDLGYGETDGLMAQLEEVSRLLTRYSAAILTPDS